MDCKGAACLHYAQGKKAAATQPTPGVGCEENPGASRRAASGIGRTLLRTGRRSAGFRATRARGGCSMLQSRQLVVDGGAIFIEEARDRFQFAGTKSREDSGGGASDASEDRPHFPGGAFAGND